MDGHRSLAEVVAGFRAGIDVGGSGLALVIECEAAGEGKVGLSYLGSQFFEANLDDANSAGILSSAGWERMPK